MSDFDKDARIHHFKQSMRELDLAITRLKREKTEIERSEALRAENTRLTAEIDKLKELLNKGNESLMKENEQLRWANAIKDVHLLLDREPK